MRKKSAYWSGFAAKCRKEFLGNVMPFWMKYGWDRKYGGVFTCLDRDGSLMDSTKSVWFQGRFGWMASYAYNHVKKDGEWHELASTWAWKHLKDRKHPEWYGYLHRDGTVAQPAKGNIFKGPFHIPRMLVKSMEICREIRRG